MNVTDYPITLGYMATSPPYSPSKPHRGIDYGLGEGVPINIQGSQIGLAGHTGLAVGPHTHVQAGRDEWAQNTIDPTPYVNKAGRVSKIGFASQWGNYACIRVGDVNVFYCHMSKISVQAGQNIGGDVNQQDFDNQVKANKIRQDYVTGSAKRLAQWFGIPTKDYYDVPEANKIIDETIKGLDYRQEIINNLQKQLSDEDKSAEEKLKKIEEIIKE